MESHQKKGSTVRGPELNEKMQQSQIEGEEFRSKNQGSDLIEKNVKHPERSTTSRASKDHSKK